MMQWPGCKQEIQTNHYYILLHSSNTNECVSWAPIKNVKVNRIAIGAMGQLQQKY